MPRTITQKMNNLRSRALRILAAGALGKCHGLAVRVTPRRSNGYDMATDELTVSWEIRDGLGLCPSRYTSCILDNLWTETRKYWFSVDRQEWGAAMAHAMAQPGDTKFYCAWCAKPSPVAGGHAACRPVFSTIRPARPYQIPRLRTSDPSCDSAEDAALVRALDDASRTCPGCRVVSPGPCDELCDVKTYALGMVL